MIIAEVSDKMMSHPALITWCLGLMIASYLLERKNRWLLLIPSVFALVSALGSIEELKDPHFSDAVIHELGYGYILLGFTPAAFILALLAKRIIEPNKSVDSTPVSAER